MIENPGLLSLGDEWHPFGARREPFPACSGMVEGHARDLKPWALAQAAVIIFLNFIPSQTFVKEFLVCWKNEG